MPGNFCLARANAAAAPLILPGSLFSRNFPGEPEPTRGTSRTSTRDPDSPFNDDLVDIQILQHLRNHAPQSGNTEFVHPDILAVNVKRRARRLFSSMTSAIAMII